MSLVTRGASSQPRVTPALVMPLQLVPSRRMGTGGGVLLLPSPAQPSPAQTQGYPGKCYLLPLLMLLLLLLL